MINLDPSKERIGFLVRHGELTNPGCWDGWGDLTLSEEGRQQAERAAHWLSFEKIGRAVCSDLPRTIETAEYLMNTGVVACPHLACDPNLRPRKVGDFTGKEKTPALLAEFQKYLDDPSLQIPDGESQDQLTTRVQVIYQYLCAPYEALPTACFVHNSVLKALMGLQGEKEAVTPGGIIGVYMDEKGEVSFQIVLGEANAEKGVS
jgi:broad specificity phosphatase PhoE